MNRTSTIPDTTQVRPHAGHAPEICWCGQDLEQVRGRHCTRCGTARVALYDAIVPRLAA